DFSADFMAQSGNRLVMECFNMGQAAGTAAALSIKDGVTPRQLDAQKLRMRLMEMDVNLTKPPAYGTNRISTEQKVRKEDILTPDENPDKGQATTVLKSGAKYECVSDEPRVEEKAVELGYTVTGGDVGTNLE
ncbi:unnamed protein product, partial [marine sediment metagenome]